MFIGICSRSQVSVYRTIGPLVVLGIPTYLYVNGSDLLPPAGFSRIELLDLSGRVLDEYKLNRDKNDPNVYSVEPFTPPEEYFYVKVNFIFLI